MAMTIILVILRLAYFSDGANQQYILFVIYILSFVFQYNQKHQFEFLQCMADDLVYVFHMLLQLNPFSSILTDDFQSMIIIFNKNRNLPLYW